MIKNEGDNTSKVFRDSTAKNNNPMDCLKRRGYDINHY